MRSRRCSRSSGRRSARAISSAAVRSSFGCRRARALMSSGRSRPCTRRSRRVRSRIIRAPWGSSLTAQFVSRRALLPEFDAPWIDEWRRTLDDVSLRSLECYAVACIGLGGTELVSAERAARQLVLAAPLRESSTVLLMEVLERRGNAAEALLAYEQLRVRLRDELGVAPAERLQAAHRRLLGPG